MIFDCCLWRLFALDVSYFPMAFLIFASSVVLLRVRENVGTTVDEVGA